MKRVHLYQPVVSLISLSLLLSACGTARMEPTLTNQPAVPSADAPAAAPTASQTPIPPATAQPSPSPVPTMSDDEFTALQNPVGLLIWSADGKSLIVEAFPNVYQVDVQGTSKARFLEKIKDFYYFLAYDSAENLLLIGGHALDLTTGKVRYQINKENLGRAVFSPDGKTLAVGTGNSITLWDATTGKFQKEIAEGVGAPGGGVYFSADGSQLDAVYVDGQGQGQVRQVDLVSGKVSEVFHLPEGPEGGCCGDFSPDLATVLINLPNYGSGHKELWDVKSQKKLITMDHYCDSDGTFTAFSPDSKYVVTGPCGTDAQLWDIQGQKLIHSFPPYTPDGFPMEWRSVVFSPDGSKLALGNDIGEVEIWDLTSYQLLGTLSIPKANP